MIETPTHMFIEVLFIIAKLWNLPRCSSTDEWIKKMWSSQALVAHACNPGYSGGRDQEDHGLKPAWANSSQDSLSRKPITHTQKELVE
jgi:hypothetical protein